MGDGHDGDLEAYRRVVDDAVRERVSDPDVRELIEAAAEARRAEWERHEAWERRRAEESAERYGPAIEQALRLAMAADREAPKVRRP